MNDKEFEYIPIHLCNIPFDGAIVYTDRWWTIRKEGHISIYVGKNKRYYSPQCNKHKFVATRRDQLGAVKIPIVYLKNSFNA